MLCAAATVNLAVLQASLSGTSWGVGDFIAGREARRVGAFAVAFYSQLVSGLALLVLLAGLGYGFTSEAFAIGSLAGVFGGIGILSFYMAMSAGPMSLVTPVTACGVVVPVIVSFVIGERPGGLAALGLALAIIGIVLVSRAPSGGVAGGAGVGGLSGRALGLSLLAALGFGAFFVVMDQGAGGDAASALWATAGARSGSLVLLLGTRLAAGRAIGTPQGRLAPIAAAGLFDVSANALYALAATAGTLAVVAVLGSLYPVVTVLLARVLLHERATRVQNLGVVAALGGVALLAGA